ncbi:MAG TPA: peptidylprolyl isomerase [Thermoanaerobaculia bacterium]|nr:peptidylprolyl isomerase [Thermoanaerobaculia bacterium]
MRKLAPLFLLLGIACSTATPPAADSPAKPAATYGMTVAEEARILALEDRREYDPALVATWVRHPNPLHRKRIALALGRIGPHAFIDTDGDKELDENEMQAGVAELDALSRDSDRSVREMAAFAIGEIGDRHGAETLIRLTAETDFGVAAEAVEALSKLGADPVHGKTHLTRYLWFTDAQYPEGVRARALRFLFRFNDDKASAAAAAALADASESARQEAAYALTRRAYEPARGQLELLLTDSNVLTRAYAATALGRIAQGPSVPKLIDALGDVHPWVRTNAAVALSRTVPNDLTMRKATDVPRILAASEDPDPGVRAAMIDVLVPYCAIDPLIINRLLNMRRNGTQWERELAAGAIAKNFGLDDPPMRDLLAELDANPSPWAIVRVLENTAPQKRGVDLRAKYATHADPLVRAAVLAAIPDKGVDKELALIRAGLTDADVIVRTNAIDRYKLVTTESRGIWLQTLTAAEEAERKSPMNDARLAAITAIADLDRPKRASYLRSLVGDPDLVVRRVAADLVVEKTGEPRPAYTPLPVSRPQKEYEEIVRWSRTPHTATIHMTRGKIELALVTQDAPMTAWNFAQLAKKKYFDNTSFMRVVPNFVIQGGDPRNDMNGGPGYAIRDEINLQKYTRGAVGMALSGPDTGGSQFFITHSPQPHLDGGYTIFGRVYDGMNGVVDQTERGDRVQTITIDEHPPIGAEQMGSVPNVSLPLVVGEITPDRLIATVPVYIQKKSDYHPDITVIEMMKSYVRAGDRVEVFMGTWCDDSQREVPKFLRIADDLKSQFGVDLPVRFVAVDKSKQQPASLLEGKSLQKVATFIYYRDGQELGRIEERPQGLFEDDLLTIVAKQ